MGNHTRARVFKSLIIGVIVGVLAVIGLRAALIKDEHTHYHANFGLYVNGARDEFKSFTFYEEIAGCVADEDNNPKARAHMHNQDNGVIHIHATGVTWGHFFANLGYSLGDNLIKTDQGIFINGADGKKLTFMLNGQTVNTLTNQVINSEDVLLVSYGSEDNAALQKQYSTIPLTAHESNTKQDPSACAGAHVMTLQERLKRAISFD